MLAPPQFYVMGTQMFIELAFIRRRRRTQVNLCAAMMIVVTTLGPASGQKPDDKSAAVQPAGESEKSATSKRDRKSSEATDDKNPFVVPADASADELFRFIRGIKRKHGRTIQSAAKSARAIIAGAMAIRNLEGIDLQTETSAIREQLSGLSFLSRFDKKSAEQLKSLVAALENDTRPEIAWLLATESFKLSC
jgi:hypothetical protein